MRRVIESDKKKQKMVKILIICIELVNIKAVKIVLVVIAISERSSIADTINAGDGAGETKIKIIKTYSKN